MADEDAFAPDDEWVDEDTTHAHEIAAMTHSPFCPTCGQRTLLGVAPEWLLTHFNNSVFRRILACLIEARRDGRTVSLTELCNFVFSDAPDGPPISAPNYVAKEITVRRFDLIEKGWLIVGPTTTGTGYSIVPFDRVAGKFV